MNTDTRIAWGLQFQKTRFVLEKTSLSVIVPTRNEAGNVKLLLSKIEEAFEKQYVEVIFVDDSSDETPRVVEESVDLFPSLNIRLIHREPDQRSGGLGGAVVIGLQAVRSEYACVMDGDLQHPPELLPVMLKKAQEKRADIVIASRRCEGSECEGLAMIRNLISRGLDLIGRIIFPKQLKNVTDPLTGFFLVKPKALDLDGLHPNGFKILLEILIRHPNLRKEEIPFHFRERHAGESKASAVEAWRYFTLLCNLRLGAGLLRFLSFALVGVSGIFINLVILYIATDLLQIYYLISAAIATVVSTLWNFGLTEAWVFKVKNAPEGRVRRLGLFFVMNMVALVLRTPLLYVLTTVMGVYYLMANLITLAVMTVSRFLLSDNLIWGQRSPSIPVDQPTFKYGD